MSMRRVAVAVCLTGTVILTSGTAGTPRAAAAGAPPPVLLEGTVVTVNEQRDVIHNGRVLVRDGRIAAVWQGGEAPADLDLAGVVRVPLGRNAYIYPGLINLHDHPFYDVLPLWQPPASHRQPSVGRPAGTEPYANRYQWNTGPAPALERARLITHASTILSDSAALGRYADVIKFGKARMILGGTTTTQGGGSSPAAYDSLLARNVESVHFGRQRIASRVPAIGLLNTTDAAALADAMSTGLLDAWLVHLAEGVRDADRRPGDPSSSRAEFAALKARQLLTDATVVIHGVGLEPEDFSEMASAPSARPDGIGDGRGAKLVWSPLSNLLLYGKTAAVYDALAAGVLVSLGTDWTPSGSANLLTELKVADRALRDPSVLGDRRHAVPGLTVGQSGQGRGAAERALDRLLVEMVTINPAKAVRWDDQVGSIERGKVADLLVIQAPDAHGNSGIPDSPYRLLIDATEQDVELVMVGGFAQAGDVAVMSALKPGDFEVIASEAACFEKAIDATSSSSPQQGGDSLVQVSARVSDGLRALGGDHPLAGGGPSSPFANTWSYLKARIPGASALPNLTFNFGLVSFFGTPDGRVNLEAIVLPPLFTADDHWWFATLEAARDPATGLTAHSAPPYGPYAANANHVTPSGSPFAAPLFRERWYGSACAKR